MSNAKAVADRLGISPNFLNTIADDNFVWNVQAYYIAQLCSAIIYVTSVKRIIIGGGLTKRKHLFEHVRKHVHQILNGYLNLSTITENINDYIVPSKLGDLIGIQSALNIAQSLVEKK